MSHKELDLELLGIHGLNPFISTVSASRAVMFSSHIAQRLLTINPDPKRIVTGLENKFSKYTFDIKMPANGRIIKMLDRYPTGIDNNSLKYNPETVVVFENDEDKSIDCFSLLDFNKFHQFFGYEYKFTDNVNKIKTGNYVAKNTVFASPSSVGPNGDYRYGFSAKVAFMSMPAVSEDGIIVRQGFLDKLKFKVYESRSIDFGLSSYPLNIYGDVNNYKPFPDIGDYIRGDGILMALRDYDSDLAPVDMSIYDTRDIDYIFDKCLFTRSGKGKVIDIKVYKNAAVQEKTPEVITEFLDKYVNAYSKFNKDLIDIEQKLRNENKKKYGVDKLKLGRSFHKMLTTAYANTDMFRDKFKQPITLLYRKNTVNEYKVDFVIEYDVTPTTGYKITDIFGGKGVICSIRPDEDMPVDELGRRADFILDPASTINRMIIGRLYEHYFNDLLEQTEMKLKQIVNFKPNMSLDDFSQVGSSLITNAYNYLIGLLQIINPGQAQFLIDLPDNDKIEYLHNILTSVITICLPPNIETNIPEAIRLIENSVYKPHVGKVSYVGNSGQRTTTENNIRIADMYMMLLDKIADDWSSVSVSKLQHFGIISPQNKSEKFSYPYRNSPVRTLGESENRVMVGYTSLENVAELMDRSNNPVTMRESVKNILEADKPTDINQLIDRNKIQYGSNKPLQMVNHLFNTAGFKLSYKRNKA